MSSNRLLSIYPSKINRIWRMVLGFCLLSVMIANHSYAKVTTSSELQPSQITAKVIRKVFPNGLTLIIKPNYDQQVVVVKVFTRMGPLYEQPAQQGISALMQHVILYGNSTYGDYNLFKHSLERVGASWGQDTYPDSGIFWLNVIKPGLDTALDAFFKRLRGPLFFEDDLARSKQNSSQNIQTYEDQPFNTLSQVFKSSFYGDHPYHWLTKGSIETLNSFRSDDLRDWYQKMYVPNNIVISVVGNVDPKQIIEKCQQNLGKMKKGPLPEISHTQLPVLTKDITSFQARNIQGALIMLGYPAPNNLNTDVPAMDLLNAMLSPRLYNELRDKQSLAYSVGSYYQTMVGPSTIIAFIATSPQNWQIARDGMSKEFRRFIDEPVSVEELQNAKTLLKGYYIMGQESSSAKAEILGHFELYGYGYRYADQFLTLIDRITPADIQRVAQKYFSHYVAAVVAPEGTVPNED